MKKVFMQIITFIVTAVMLVESFCAGIEEADTGNLQQEQQYITKEVAFELTKEYEGCSFTIKTSVKGTFTVVLSHDLEEYTGQIEDGTECIINVQDAKSGKWKVKVIAELPAANMFENESKTDEEQAETPSPENTRIPTSDEVIGQIKVSAKAIDKTAFAVGNVEVARDIVGLKYYFKDNAIVVEWTDNSCGNVNVAIIDTNTSQILDKKTVSGKYYEYELPELTKEITIDVVPATSAGIIGAANQYTIKVENNPDAIITFDNLEYTNKNTISYTAELGDTYSLKMYCNEEEAGETPYLQKGNYTEEIPLYEGMNNVKVYVVDRMGNMRSFSYSVILDSIKPALTLNMEYDGAKTYDDICYIEGTIKDYETFTINEVVPVVSGDGSFVSEYRLNSGNNILNIRATDKAGNETLYVANIEKLEKKPLDINKIILICAAVILVVALCAALLKRNRGYNKDNKNKKEERPEKPMKDTKTKIPRKISIVEKWRQLKEWQKTLIELVIVFAVAMLIFTRVIINGVIPSGSMEPTLEIGDVAIANGLAYTLKTPERGDIIIFNRDGVTLIKRVIGVPGDSLMFVDGYLYLNGELVYEEYLPENTETNSFKDFEDIPDGCYFVMGDNREHSYDSRAWDDPYVREDAIRGKMICDIPISKLKRSLASLRSELPF